MNMEVFSMLSIPMNKHSYEYIYRVRPRDHRFCSEETHIDPVMTSYVLLCHINVGATPITYLWHVQELSGEKKYQILNIFMGV